jgi:flavin reductase (DIM6/NTAB) family NADH-FMN oxidoreductase RutF
MAFVETNVNELSLNPFQMIGREWMLITAGDSERFNSMTAAWGGFGSLWIKNVAFTFIRPERYTFEFANKYDFFSLTFFEEAYREQLHIMGQASGRDTDKVKACGFTAAFYKGVPYYEQASLALICKKIYFDDIKLENMAPESQKVYADGNGVHRMYVGEVLAALKPE